MRYNDSVVLVAAQILSCESALDGFVLRGASIAPRVMQEPILHDMRKLPAVGSPKKNLFHELANFAGVLAVKGQLELSKVDLAYRKGNTPYPVYLMAVLVDGTFDEKRQLVLTSPIETCAECCIGGWFPGDPIVLVHPDELKSSLCELEEFVICAPSGEPVALAPYLSELTELARCVCMSSAKNLQ